jgi:hypothetical protein
MWTNLVILSKGQVVYAGRVDKVRSYIQDIRLWPSTSNKADKFGVEYALELAGQPLTAESLIKAWASKYHRVSTPVFQEDMDMDEEADRPAQLSARTASPLDYDPLNFLFQLRVLCHRYCMYSLLSVHGFWAVIGRSLLCGLLYGTLYRRNLNILYKHGQIMTLAPFTFDEYAYNLLGINFSMVCNLMFVNSVAVPALYHLSRYYDIEKVPTNPPNLLHSVYLISSHYIILLVEEQFVQRCREVAVLHNR